MTTDARVDAYIAKAPAFAQPILTEARRRIWEACPEVEETIKWNVPFYLLNGAILANTAAVKAYVKVGVWASKKPEFADVESVDDLPEEAEFLEQLSAGIARIGGDDSSGESDDDKANGGHGDDDDGDDGDDD